MLSKGADRSAVKVGHQRPVMNGSFHATKSLVPSRAASMPTMPLGEQFAAGLLDIEFARDDALDFLVDQVMPAVREFAARGDIDHQTDLLSGYFLELLSLGAPTPGGVGRCVVCAVRVRALEAGRIPRTGRQHTVGQERRELLQWSAPYGVGAV